MFKNENMFLNIELLFLCFNKFVFKIMYKIVNFWKIKYFNKGILYCYFYNMWFLLLYICFGL